MKRVIRASLADTNEYVKASSKYVTYILISDLLEHRFKESTIKELVNAVHSWKGNNFLYHHNDRDTYNNDPTNVILITRSAHGVLHNVKNELLWMRYFGLASLPQYTQGELALETEIQMYNKLGEVCDFHKYDSNQILEIVSDSESIELLDELDSGAISISEFQESYRDYLSSVSINVLQSDVLRKHLDSIKSENRNKVLDPYYIDDDTALEVLKYLKELRDASSKKIRNHSIDAIINFIRNNRVSSVDIAKQHFGKNFSQEYWDKHHPMKELENQEV